MKREIYILVTIIGLALLLIGVEYDALLCIVGAVMEVVGATLLLLNLWKHVNDKFN